MEKVFVIVSEFILGYMLQSIACVLWLSAFIKGKMALKQFVFLSVLFTIITIVARVLPITFGIHTIIIIIALILVGIWELKLDVYRSVIIGSTALALIMFCETIVFAGMYYFFIGDDILNVFLTTKLFYNKTPGIIANVFFFLLVTIIYLIKESKKAKRYKTWKNSSKRSLT